MKEIVILSGKGGTGKTTITASFASLVSPVVVVDADVDAANLNLLLKAKITQREKFSGGEVARINLDVCTECGLCRDVCRFDAISEDYVVDEFACEGCVACQIVCPVDAIDMIREDSGRWRIGELDNNRGWLVDARLKPGGSNNGKLVEEVRSIGKLIAEGEHIDLILVDGAPGVGCPVISSITGTSGVVAVTEPTVAAIHDLKRLLELTEHFRLPVVVIINRFDIDEQLTAQIKDFLKSKGIPVVGQIPFDFKVYEALKRGEVVVNIGGPASDAIVRAWEAVKAAFGLTGV